MKKISIIQPYFYPYLNYFRLINKSDIFVILDNVQFNRRGFVHRNFIIERNKKKWITLPIKKCPQNTLIKDVKLNRLEFENFNKKIEKIFKSINLEYDIKIYNTITLKNDIFLLDYLIKNLFSCLDIFKIKKKIYFSSELNIDGKKDNLIINICKSLDAKYYYNLPGGKKLYDKSKFKQNNLELIFLDDYNGVYESCLVEILKKNYFLNSIM